MSILTEPLPETVVIDGNEYAVRTDYTNMIKFEMLMLDNLVSERNKIKLSLNLFYPAIPPNDQEAVKEMYKFYQAGIEIKKGAGEGSGGNKKIYDYDYDAHYIYSAFLSDYGIDLQEYLTSGETLHWWKFRSLFISFKEDNFFSKIMGFRNANLKELKGEQRKLYAKMQKQFAIPTPKDEQEKLDTVADALINGKNIKDLI